MQAMEMRFILTTEKQIISQMKIYVAKLNKYVDNSSPHCAILQVISHFESLRVYEFVTHDSLII